VAAAAAPGPRRPHCSPVPLPPSPTHLGFRPIRWRRGAGRNAGGAKAGLGGVGTGRRDRGARGPGGGRSRRGPAAQRRRGGRGEGDS
jgi:hypothetical protein